MSLISIANAVADETNGPRPVSIAGNTAPDALKIFRIINKVGGKLMRAFPWQILGKEHAFSATGNETILTAANIPSNFNRFIPETFWDRDAADLLSGPISPVEWSGLKVQTVSSINPKFIYRGGDILALPIFGAGVSMAFEYVSENWCQSAALAAQPAFLADTDTALIDEELLIHGAIWTWLDAEGQPAAAALSEYQDYFDQVAENDAASAGIVVTGDIFAQRTRHFTGEPTARIRLDV